MRIFIRLRGVAWGRKLGENPARGVWEPSLEQPRVEKWGRPLKPLTGCWAAPLLPLGSVFSKELRTPGSLLRVAAALLAGGCTLEVKSSMGSGHIQHRPDGPFENFGVFPPLTRWIGSERELVLSWWVPATWPTVRSQISLELWAHPAKAQVLPLPPGCRTPRSEFSQLPTGGVVGRRTELGAMIGDGLPIFFRTGLLLEIVGVHTHLGPADPSCKLRRRRTVRDMQGGGRSIHPLPSVWTYLPLPLSARTERKDNGPDGPGLRAGELANLGWRKERASGPGTE